MPRGNKKKEKTTSILFVADMPRPLMNAFGAWCRLRELTYKEVLSKLIREKIQYTDVEYEDAEEEDTE